MLHVGVEIGTKTMIKSFGLNFKFYGTLYVFVPRYLWFARVFFKLLGAEFPQTWNIPRRVREGLLEHFREGVLRGILKMQ